MTTTRKVVREVGDCPARMLALEAATRINLMLELEPGSEQPGNDCGVGPHVREELYRDLVQEVSVIEDRASYLAANSSRGALFQLLIAIADVSNLEESKIDDSLPLYQRINRLLRSAAQSVSRQSGISVEEVGCGYYSADNPRWAAFRASTGGFHA